MSNTNPARGMRDFLPADIRKRNYVINIIKQVYESYGFEPLETPSVENLETLTGKYGEEGNQLMFKILKRGEKLQQELSEGKITNENELTDLALRYDLTVPLARVVANYKNELPKFFKRYQIQPVWRADRPAKGRFREFYQCDVDAIGSDSMMVEAELCAAVSEILTRLGFETFDIRLNHRKLLSAILEVAGVPDEKQTDALVALDKIDKIGREGVEKEFKARGISDEAGVRLLTAFEFFVREISAKTFSEPQKLQLVEIFKYQKDLSDDYNELLRQVELQVKDKENLEHVFELTKTHRNTHISLRMFEDLEHFLKNNETGIEGLKELRKIWGYSNMSAIIPYIKIDPSLARGLSYYTGAIFEINVPDLAGSLGGGGRYDGLIGMFGKEQIPACGFSLGLERILVVMEERGMFQKLVDEGKLKLDSADVLITILEKKEKDENNSITQEILIGESLALAAELRAQNLRVLVYPEADKLGKQFKYADSLKIPFVCVLGESELTENKVTLKNLHTGEQEMISREEIEGKIFK